jgi:hypothetical protein
MTAKKSPRLAGKRFDPANYCREWFLHIVDFQTGSLVTGRVRGPDYRRTKQDNGRYLIATGKTPEM